ncbi:hypothetical protein BGZ83_004232 [Gryganskiella cystojenkinii]|nr:hypothetical protein BGZ83_004232 [Gryganskiella cystojenkinii]
MIRDESAFEAQAALDSIAATALAAAAVSAASTGHVHEPEQILATRTTTTLAAPVAAPAPVPATEDSRKRELVSEKVRTENRERKKRWREQNEERNKDNDLRCRVNKRANKMLGNVDSDIKARWIEEEFAKRQWKRKDKERRRNPDSAGSVEPVPPPPVSTISLNDQIALHQQQQQQHQQHQQHQQAHQLHDHTNHLSHPFDPKTAQALTDLVKKTASSNGGSHLDLAQLTGVLTDPDLARQLIEMDAASNPQTAAASLLVLNAPTKIQSEPEKPHVMDADYPMDAVLTLMQLNGAWKA